MVRRLHHGGSVHFVIEQPDGTRSLLPAWMTEPWAAQLTIFEKPRLTLEVLHALHSAINGALLSLSPCSMMRGKCDDGATSRPPAARSARARGQRARAQPNTTTDSAEVMFLLTLLMAEHMALAAALPVEASNE